MENSELSNKLSGNKKMLLWKPLLFCVGLVFLASLLSEVIYIYHNNSPSLFINLSSFCLREKIYGFGSFFLQKASEVKGRSYIKNYPDIINEKTDFSLDKSVFEKYGVYIYDYSDKQILLVYYELGLSAYEDNDINLALSIWEKALYLNPDLSDIYIELANLYSVTGNSSQAKHIIEKCIRFHYPKDHCISFYESNIIKGINEKPGFMENSIIENTSHD